MSSESSKKSDTAPHVRYARNINHMKTEDLMDDLLPINYLYSKINIAQDAALFFTDTQHGADFDLRLRERFIKGFEALLSANPLDGKAITEAQQECLVVIGIYETIASQIQMGESSKKQLENEAHQEDEGE